jgi:hypothetical protein
MPKGKVLHHQRVIGRVFRAAKATEYPVETIEFTADGNIIVRPRNQDDVTGQPAASDISEVNPWDEVLGNAADQKRPA